MACWSQYQFDDEAKYCYIAREHNFRNRTLELFYKLKTYGSLPSKTIKIIEKSKLEIGENLATQLMTEKRCIEIYQVLKAIGARKKPIEKYKLLDYGFPRSTIKYCIKKLISLGLVEQHENGVKITKKKLVNKGERFFRIKSNYAWKAFLLFGLRTCLNYLILVWVKKSAKNKSSKILNSSKLALCQNALFIGNSNSSILRSLRKIACALKLSYRELFYVKVKYDKKDKCFKANRFLRLDVSLIRL